VTATIFSWNELPFRELWCVDFEYYPGRGLANGGREGDAVTPLCLVAQELRTGRASAFGRMISARSALSPRS
jgi:hypothetical protein